MCCHIPRPAARPPPEGERFSMKRMLFSAALIAAVGLGTVAAFSQANEDEVATAMKKYPLAASAGVDSHAIDHAPAGALNQGKFDDKSWKFGTAYDAPAG